MLEKIGLPAKPSLKGNTWVIDASHCQGCSSQFTFINRKHHCRRCGGMFCGSCTQNRMILRGQGNSHVRICEPCRHLEEAARFQMKLESRIRTGRGGLRPTLRNEDEILSQIPAKDNKHSFSTDQESDIVSDNKKAASSASCSEVSAEDSKNIYRNLCPDESSHLIKDLRSASPEELRKQAVEEKKMYKVLKGDGKSEDALKAFKRAKEFERQAEALELSLRKNRRKDSSKSSQAQTTKNGLNESCGGKDKSSPPLGLERDDHVAAELKELGWSDADIHAGVKKPDDKSLEGELFSLIGEVSQKKGTDKRLVHSNGQMEVVALKKKALILKREGKLSEAKEELKRAKLLEKQLEEQEFFAGAEDSDDEITSLIHSMEVDKHDDFDLSTAIDLKPGFDFSHIGVADDFNVENFEVTDEDMNDPEIVSALSSLGWGDESFQQPDRNIILSEIRSLKKMAVNQKKAGNASEALQILKKAKLLEKNLNLDSSEGFDSKAPLHETLNGLNYPKCEDIDPPKSKAIIQKELLGLKKKALGLRREGEFDKAEEELKKGEALEQQLQAMENTKETDIISINISDNEEEAEATEQDLGDPTYLALLKNLGWEDEEDNDRAAEDFNSNVPKRSRIEIQSEILGLKRKALAFRREGDMESAEQQLRMAGVLESEMADMEKKQEQKLESAEQKLRMAGVWESEMADMEQKQEQKLESCTANVTPEGENLENLAKQILDHKRKAVAMKREGKLSEAREELQKAKMLEKIQEKSNAQVGTDDMASKSLSSGDHFNAQVGGDNVASSKALSSRDRFKVQQESLAHKRRALKLRREGRMEEAESESEIARALEAQLECSSPENVLDPQAVLDSLRALGVENEEAVDSERAETEECMRVEKMKAVNLKREGRQMEALAAFRHAKLLERKLNL